MTAEFQYSWDTLWNGRCNSPTMLELEELENWYCFRRGNVKMGSLSLNIFKIDVPEKWHESTLMQTELRQKGVHVVVIEYDDGSLNIHPCASDVLWKNTSIWVAFLHDDVQSLRNLVSDLVGSLGTKVCMRYWPLQTFPVHMFFAWIGKAIKDSNIRANHGINIAGVQTTYQQDFYEDDDGDWSISWLPGPEFILEVHHSILVTPDDHEKLWMQIFCNSQQKNLCYPIAFWPPDSDIIKRSSLTQPPQPLRVPPLQMQTSHRVPQLTLDRNVDLVHIAKRKSGSVTLQKAFERASQEAKTVLLDQFAKEPRKIGELAAGDFSNFVVPAFIKHAAACPKFVDSLVDFIMQQRPSNVAKHKYKHRVCIALATFQSDHPKARDLFEAIINDGFEELVNHEMGVIVLKYIFVYGSEEIQRQILDRVIRGLKEGTYASVRKPYNALHLIDLCFLVTAQKHKEPIFAEKQRLLARAVTRGECLVLKTIVQSDRKKTAHLIIHCSPEDERNDMLRHVAELSYDGPLQSLEDMIYARVESESKRYQKSNWTQDDENTMGMIFGGMQWT